MNPLIPDSYMTIAEFFTRLGERRNDWTGKEAGARCLRPPDAAKNEKQQALKWWRENSPDVDPHGKTLVKHEIDAGASKTANVYFILDLLGQEAG